MKKSMIRSMVLFCAIGISHIVASVVCASEVIDTSFIEPAIKSSCELHLEQKHTQALLDEEIRAFQSLAEEALSLRAVTIKVGQRMQQQAQADLPLSGEDMDLLSNGLAIHLELRHKLLEFAQAHECWLYMSQKQLRKAGINSQQRLDGIMLSLASALVMYDNYMLTATLFEGDPKLRQLLNDGDQGYQLNKAELLKVALSYNSTVKRARVRRGMRYYEEAVAQGRRKYADPYLAALIEQSPSYDMVREWSPLHVLSKKLDVYKNITSDSIDELQNDGVSLFSMLFGNTVGLVETRKGKLYQDGAIHTELQKTLQSGDILLEKTPFRLTDKLIPGYWGHAAIWIGTEPELKELGLWKHPLVQRYHEEIRSGHGVVEALRSGVEMNPLEKFLNIDSVGVLRKHSLTKQDRKTIVLQALRQV
ncbi:MAG: YiiX/YebB-like N1pC/P60 family cysteine hydrolase, partial [Desulfuromonadales bacterium]|nr:YiiX/YebB-like N1pC/P60 family cysteine hydrolase [Desulfuromonadales bacterium]